MAKVGRKLWEPTDEERRTIRAFAAAGASHGTISRLVGKSEDSLQRHCPIELTEGKADIIALVGSRIIQRALGNDNTAAIFVLKTQGSKHGWSEKLALTGDDGGPILHSMRVELVDGEFPANDQATGSAET